MFLIHFIWNRKLTLCIKVIILICSSTFALNPLTLAIKTKLWLSKLLTPNLLPLNAHTLNNLHSESELHAKARIKHISTCTPIKLWDLKITTGRHIELETVQPKTVHHWIERLVNSSHLNCCTMFAKCLQIFIANFYQYVIRLSIFIEKYTQQNFKLFDTD